MKIATNWRSYRLLLLTLLLLPSTLFVNAQLSYTFAQLSNGYTYNAGANIINANTNDGISSVQNIGFTFTYNCNTYTQFTASSNGWMSLGTAMTGSHPGNEVHNFTQGPILRPLCDDTKISNTGNVNIKLTGVRPARA